MNELSDVVRECWSTYQGFLEGNPFLGSVLTAEFTVPFGDIVSQLIRDRKVRWKQVGYSASLAPLYGSAAYGLLESGELVGKAVSEHPLAKAALGPNLWGNLYTTFFFVNNTVGERVGYSLKKLAQHYRNLFSNDNPEKEERSRWQNFKEKYIANIPGREYLNSVIATLTVWNVFQYMNYEHVPESMRTPASLAAGVIWIPLLSFWSLKGRRKIVYGGDQ